MTREELKKHCLKQVEDCEMWARFKREEPHGKIYEEHRLILELLEQEPCENYVSREAVIDLVADYDLNMDQVVKGIHALPLITPSRPKAHWIDDNCSICGYGVNPWNKTPYCPNCGAKMEG